MNGENPRLKNPLLPRCVQSSLSSTDSTQHMRELLAGNRTSRNQVGAVDTHLLSNMLSDWLVSLMGLRGCLFSISSWCCDINHPLIPTCWIVFILRVWLSRDIPAALFIVSCAKRFAIIFYSYSCIRSSCPIHFALHVPFSWLLFGCLLSIRLTSFGKSVVNVVLFIRCLMFLFISAKGSPRLCFIYSILVAISFFMSLLFYPSLCVSYACRPCFTKRGLGECPRCLIEGSLQIVRNVVPILAEQAPKTEPKWNCPSALVFVGSSHFSCKTSTKDDRCFVVNSR